MPNISYPSPRFAAAPPIPGLDPSPGLSPYAVWRGSTTDDVRFVPVSKKAARVWYQKVRAWDRRSKTKGRHGGGIGLTSMAVLHAFHVEFLNFASGRLAPSYEGIARMRGLARSTVAAAIARLKRLGIINWVRRCASFYDGGVFTLRQPTNAYAILPPSHWRGHVDREVFAAPWPDTCGATAPLSDLVTQGRAAERDGASLTRLAGILDADGGDPLAASLAALARSLARSGA